MATFIKLPDGTITNTAKISQISSFVKTYVTRYDMPNDDSEPKKAAIRVVFLEGREQEFLFADEAERDTEFLKLEKSLMIILEPVFPNLTLDLTSMRAVHCSWQGGMFNTLQIQIVTDGGPTFEIDVSEDDEAAMGRAKCFLDRFNVEIPLSRKQRWAREKDDA